MGIVTFPSFLASLLMVAIAFAAGPAPAAGVAGTGAGEIVALAESRAADVAPVREVATSFGRSWWQVRASATIMQLPGLPTAWIAKVEALGSRAVIQHDAVRATPFFALDLPDLPDLSLDGLRHSLRF